VESAWTHLNTSCPTDVWSLYSDICTPEVRMSCGVCMETSVHEISELCVESLCRHFYTICHTDVWESVGRHLYTYCQIDLWSLYGDICTPVVRLMYAVCMENVYKRYQTNVWSLYGDFCTPFVRLKCGVCMETQVYT
jgi:hypothetical protein